MHVELAGGVRRLADSVKDLDIVAASDDPPALAAALADVDLVESVDSARRERRAGAHAQRRVGRPARRRRPTSSATCCSTSRAPSSTTCALRERAVRKGLHVSEYGILDDATGETLRCATEEEVYARLGLTWVPPELREDRGELEPGFVVPDLIVQDDLKGDLHCHTIASDGRNTVEEMARGALERGHEYVAITDHSATHGFGNDVSPDALRAPDRAGARARRRARRHRGAVGTETNILPDGSPDYDDELLAAARLGRRLGPHELPDGRAEMTGA